MGIKPEDSFNKQIRKIDGLLKQAGKHLAPSKRDTKDWPERDREIRETVIPALQQYEREAKKIQKPLRGLPQRIERINQLKIAYLNKLAKDAPRHLRLHVRQLEIWRLKLEVRLRRLGIMGLKLLLWLYPKRIYLALLSGAILIFVFRAQILYWLNILLMLITDFVNRLLAIFV